MRQQEFWFSLADAARILGVRYQTLYEAIRTGRITARIQGSSYYISPSDLFAYAIRTKKDPEFVVRQIQDLYDVPIETIFIWYISGATQFVGPWAGFFTAALQETPPQPPRERFSLEELKWSEWLRKWREQHGY